MEEAQDFQLSHRGRILALPKYMLEDENIRCWYPQCNYRGADMTTMMSHQKNHNNALRCNYCDCNDFSVADDASNHIRAHLSEKVFLCMTCNAIFVDNRLVVVHILDLHRNAETTFLEVHRKTRLHRIIEDTIPCWEICGDTQGISS